MSDHESIVRAAVEALRHAGMEAPEVAVILGSGLGSFAETLETPYRLETGRIPGYPNSTVPGHAGRVFYGRIRVRQSTSPLLLVFQGRIHPYEGVPVEYSALNVRIAAALGVRTVILTNAAGGIHPELRSGDFMLHDDLISLPLSPRRRIEAAFGQPHKSLKHNAYDPDLQRLVEDAALSIGERIRRGVYCYVSGPTYETPSEVTMLRILGADAVGMSTYSEVAVAGELGVRTVAVSLITNLASGLSAHSLSHADVTANAQKASERFTILLKTILTSL